MDSRRNRSSVREMHTAARCSGREPALRFSSGGKAQARRHTKIMEVVFHASVVANSDAQGALGCPARPRRLQSRIVWTAQARKLVHNSGGICSRCTRLQGAAQTGIQSESEGGSDDVIQADNSNVDAVIRPAPRGKRRRSPEIERVAATDVSEVVAAEGLRPVKRHKEYHKGDVQDGAQDRRSSESRV